MSRTSEVRVSIGQVKRDISELVNRVAYGHERIVLTSRGKPKAVLVSLDDYERLKQAQVSDVLARWQAWLAESRQLSADILERRQGKPVDVDRLWEETRADLEARNERMRGD